MTPDEIPKRLDRDAPAVMLAAFVLDAFIREGFCPLCGTVSPPCRCIAIARRIVE